MLSDETLKALVEAILFVAPEPVSLDGVVKAIEGEEKERVKAQIEALIEEYQRPAHGIQIRQVAGGYKFYTKPEHHEVLREFVKSLKPPIRLSRAALETLAVIAYRQPVTIPEIDEIRGVNCGGVIHTLLEKKLIVTAGRKNVVGRPILYRTSREFLVQFGLKDVNELPSLKEFEELARQALGSEMPAATPSPPETPSAEQPPAPEATTPVETAAETATSPDAVAPSEAPTTETAPQEAPSLSPVEPAVEQKEADPKPPPDDIVSE
jgi:segregation and condensation protein B